MAEIKCPKCGEIIKLDKSSYDALLNDVEKEELNKRVEEQIKQIEAKYKAEYNLEAAKLQSQKNNEVAELNKKIALLNEQLKGTETANKLEVIKAVESLKEELNKKDQEITKLKGDVDASKKDGALSNQQLKEKYEFLLKAKDDEIERYKNFRMGDSTKDLGESLEQYCHDAFDEVRSFAFPNAYFEKDNALADGSKGDFIFRDTTEDGIEIVSIMFEMKNQKDDTEHKHKNEEFFKKLDKDRTAKGCEYAVLVSTLEEESKLYNSGIVDVSHRYPKMYVVRPQNFLAIIGLIRNMALENLKYKRSIIAYQKENVDVTNFESAVKAVMQKINDDYENASRQYDKVDKMCDDIIKKVNEFRETFRLGQKWIGAAQNQLPNLEVRKLTKNNPTMKEKFDNLEDKKG